MFSCSFAAIIFDEVELFDDYLSAPDEALYDGAMLYYNDFLEAEENDDGEQQNVD
jgi:hypothetical protein